MKKGEAETKRGEEGEEGRGEELRMREYMKEKGKSKETRDASHLDSVLNPV